MQPGKTILLVEDSASDVELARRAFAKGQIRTNLVVASDGQEALDYLFAEGAYAGRDRSDLPALTLLDLKLPKVSGLEVLRRIRNEPLTRWIPVVVLSSSREQRDIAAAYDLRANSYLQKPVDFQHFVETVLHLGAYWLTLNEPPPIWYERPAEPTSAHTAAHSAI
jgi:CheY-like chemotaxis protein